MDREVSAWVVSDYGYGSFDDALRGLHEDREFLKQGGFTDRLVDAWITQRRESPAAAALDA